MANNICENGRARSDRPSLTIGVDGRFLQDKFHGVGRYTFGLLTGLCALEGDHRIVVFMDPSLPDHRFRVDGLVASGRLTVRPITLPLYHPQELWAWPRILRETPLDLFHAPFFWSPLVLPCPLVTTFHDMIFDRYPHYIPGWRFLPPYKVVSRLAVRRSRRIIAVSEATRRDILHFTHTDPRKVVSILSGVDPAFAMQAANAQAVREKYSLPDRYILAVGARRPHKNIPRLVAAFSQLAPAIEQSLVLVGSVDRRFAEPLPSGANALRSTGRIREIAFVEEEDMPALYAGADLFVQPSVIEGFGLPVLEAMVCGCPVACSDASSLPEVAGDAAFYFDPSSEDAIARAIRQALAAPDLRETQRQRGLFRAHQFNWRETAAKTLALYHAAIQERAGRQS